jgi:hypothetical protein
MSGLFASLAAAARGEAPVLTAPTRGTFEPDGEDQGNPWLEDPGEAGERDGQDAARSPELPAALLKEQGRGDNGPVDPLVAQAGVSAPRQQALVPNTKGAPQRSVPDADDEAPSAHRTSHDRPRVPADQQDRLLLTQDWPPSPNALIEAPDAQEYLERAHQDVRRRDGLEPALLPMPLGQVADDPVSLPTAAAATATRAPVGRSLSIGRIEVRPPPAAPPPAPTYRAPTIARAMPRQSLDDYRRRGR